MSPIYRAQSHGLTKVTMSPPCYAEEAHLSEFGWTRWVAIPTCTTWTHYPHHHLLRLANSSSFNYKKQPSLGDLSILSINIYIYTLQLRRSSWRFVGGVNWRRRRKHDGLGEIEGEEQPGALGGHLGPPPAAQAPGLPRRCRRDGLFGLPPHGRPRPWEPLRRRRGLPRYWNLRPYLQARQGANLCWSVFSCSSEHCFFLLLFIN